MILLINLPRTAKMLFTFHGIEKPLSLRALDEFACGIESTLVCWILFWKNEHRKVKILFNTADHFNQPRNTEVDLCTVKI